MTINVRERIREINTATGIAAAATEVGLKEATAYLKYRDSLLQKLEAEIKALEEKAWQYDELT